MCSVLATQGGKHARRNVNAIVLATVVRIPRMCSVLLLLGGKSGNGKHPCCYKQEIPPTKWGSKLVVEENTALYRTESPQSKNG